MIVHKLPEELPHIHVYMMADGHIGSREHNATLYRRFIKTVQDDPYGYFVIAGDMLNNGLKNSRSNVYEETMPPSKQKEYLYESLKPIKEKLLCGTPGNHCRRSSRETDTYPMHDVFMWLGIGDLYRENCCFMKVNLGVRKRPRQCSYIFAVTHGVTKNKTVRWTECVDGIDVFVTGHTHAPEIVPPSKIRVDAHNEKVILRDYIHIVCNPFTTYGGYALAGMFTPKNNERIQMLTLSGVKKEITVTT